MRWFVVLIPLLALGQLSLASGWEATVEREIYIENAGWSPLAAYSLSPDGRWFVQVSPEKGLSLWDTEAGDFRGVFEPTERGYWIQEKHIAWSPSGKYLAFWSLYPQQARGELWLLEPEQGILRLLSAACPALLPAWSPDGDRLAVVCGRKNGGQILTMSLGGQDKEVVTTYEGEIQWVRWVGGGEIIYAVVTGDEAPEYEVWKISSETAHLVWEHEAFESDLGAISPDGRYLWFSPLPELLDLETGDTIPLWRSGEERYPQSSVASLVWSPDAKQFLYTYLYQDSQGKTYFPLLLGEFNQEGKLAIQRIREPSPGPYLFSWNERGYVWAGQRGKEVGFYLYLIGLTPPGE